LEAFARELDVVDLFQMRRDLTVARAPWISKEEGQAFEAQLNEAERRILGAGGDELAPTTGGIRIGDIAAALGGIDVVTEPVSGRPDGASQ